MFKGKRNDNEKYAKLSLFQISKILNKDNINELKVAIRILKETSNLSAEEILNLILEEKEGILIPVSLFQNRNLSSLQILVKYLKENLNLNFSSISKLLNRDQRTIWTTYKVAIKKFEGKIISLDSELKIPVSKFANRELSTLEVLIDFLKSNFNFKNSEISRLINRDSRTVWTITRRIKEKNEIKR